MLTPNGCFSKVTLVFHESGCLLFRIVLDEVYMTTHLNSSRNSGTQLKKDLASSYEMTYYNNQNAVQSAADQRYIQSNGWADDDHLNWEVKRLQVSTE